MRFPNLLFLCLLASASLFVSSCGDDDERTQNQIVNDDLDGDWDATSVVGQSTITSELLGNANGFSRVTLEFEKQGPEDGEYLITFVSNVDGSTSPIRGDYEIENNGREIVLMPASGGIDEEYDIEIEDDELEMDGLLMLDGTSLRIIIEADRD